MSHLTTVRKRVTRRRAIIGVLSLLLVVVLVAAACGEDATPTPLPATAVPSAPAPTAVPAAPAPTAMPDAPAPTAVPAAPAPTAVPSAPAPTAVPDEPTTGLRPMSEWTDDNPATSAEVNAELEKRRGQSLVFTSWGGAYQAAQRQAYLIPFQAEFGIEIIEESPMEYARVTVMAETGNITWHVMDFGTRGAWAAVNNDTLELLPPGSQKRDDFLDVAVSEYFGGGGITWSTVLAYSTETYPDGGPQPSSWADYFDRDKFPGRRGIRDNFRGSWLVALSALHPDWYDDPVLRLRLGAPTDADVQEALEQWNTFSPEVFWHTGSDCPQLLISGELDMCTAWNGRIFDATQQGANLGIAWEAGHLVGTGVFAMTKGLKESDPEAYELGALFMAWTGFAERNAEISKYITYGPTNILAVPLLDGPDFAAVLPHLPTSAANSVYAIMEDEFWSGQKNGEWTELWQEYMQSQ